MRPHVFSSLKSRVSEKTIRSIFFVLKTNYFFSHVEIKVVELQETSRNLSESLAEVNC